MRKVAKVLHRRFVVMILLQAMFFSMIVLPAHAIAFETFASLLLFGFNKADQHVDYNPTTKGEYTASQELPLTLKQATLLDAIFTPEGGVSSGSVVHPFSGKTPYGEPFAPVRLEPFSSSIARRYDYSVVKINKKDAPAEIMQEIADASGLKYDAGSNRIIGMIDHVYYTQDPQRVALGLVDWIEVTCSMQGGEKVSTLMKVQSRTLVQLIALIRKDENMSRYLDDTLRAYFTAGQLRPQQKGRDVQLVLNGSTLDVPVEFLVYDTYMSPLKGSPRTERQFTVLPGTKKTIMVAAGQVVVVKVVGQPKVFGYPEPGK